MNSLSSTILESRSCENNSHLNLSTSTVIVEETEPVNHVPQAPPVVEAPAQPQAPNRAPAPAQPNDAGEREDDWLSLMHNAISFLILFCIVYYYSSFERLVVIFSIALFLIL